MEKIREKASFSLEWKTEWVMRDDSDVDEKDDLWWSEWSEN